MQNRPLTPLTRQLPVPRPTSPIVRTWLWGQGNSLRPKRNKMPAGAVLAALVLATCAALPVTARAAVSYSAFVLTNQPMAYWKLSDTEDPSTGTAVVLDSSTNGLNGLYATSAMNGFNSVVGPQPPDFPGFPTNTWALGCTAGLTLSYANVPLGNLGTNAVTFTAWVYLNGAQANWTGFLMNRGTAEQGGMGMNGSGMLAYTWNNNNADTWNWVSGLTIPLDQWSFVAMAIAPTEATLYLDYVDTNGVSTYLSAVNAIPHTPDTFGTGFWEVGADGTDGTRTLNGSMAHVAVFGRTLSASEVEALFEAGFGITQVTASISQQPTPASVTMYAGRSVSFSASASGVPAPTYQWQGSAAATGPFTNVIDSATIAGSTTASLTISNVTAADAGAYRIVTTNIVGAATSAVATVTVLGVAPPLGPYANAVYTNGPLAYWRLNESYAQTNAVDYVGDLSGTYGGAGLWGLDSPSGPIPGPTSPAFPGFEATNSAVNTSGDGVSDTWVTVPTPRLRTNTVTFLAWVNPTTTPPDWTGLLMSRSGGEQGGMGMGGGNSAGMLAYTWNNNSTWSFVSGLTIPLNQWSMVAMVIEPTMASLYLCSGDTITNSFDLIAHDVEYFGTAAAIGNDTCCGAGRLFPGTIDEVAVFEKALSFDEIDSLYGVALGKTLVIAPWFVSQPTPALAERYAGLTVTFYGGLVTGSSPSYQWLQGNLPLADGPNISGAHTDTITLSNLAATNAGNYRLVASNSSGSATGSVATLTVEPRTPAYAEAVLSLDPVTYWRLNETEDPSPGTVIAFDYVGGFDGTYGTNALNGFNGIGGPSPTNGFAIFETNNTALESTASIGGSWMTAPQPALNTNTATFTMWVYPNGDQADWTGLFMNRSGDGEGVGYGGYINTTNNSHNMLAYTWNNNSTWSYVSGLTIPMNQWSMLAVAVAPTEAILYVINTNGVQTATNAVAQTVEAWGGTASVGNDPGNNNARIFNGIADEVAMFNYTLTPAQIQNLYAGVVSLPRPTLKIGPAASGKLAISWSGPGTLQSTPTLQPTTWTPLGTNNPTVLTPAGKAQFYRVLLP